jgi:hypothetical protein
LAISAWKFFSSVAPVAHVCLQSFDIEADCGSDFEHLGLVDLAARQVKRLMEDSVFALLVGRESCLGGNYRTGAKNWKLFSD